MFRNKIIQSEALHVIVNKWKASGKKIVFTNGCFDILHLGHVDYLEKAKKLGDVLIVGLNSDLSVSRLKGKNRPIQDETSRSGILASMACVDFVIIFDQDTPIELIKTISPNVLTKGGDWELNKIIGSDHVISYGGTVTTIPFLKGYSTTQIENKIKNQCTQ